MNKVRKSLLKTVSWMAISFLLLLVVTFILTGQWLLAAEIAVLELVLKAVVYYVHEHLWEHR